MKKVAFIGAGPAGIALSLFLKNWDGEVHLFEQNKSIGEKLKLTGGGRMNITNRNLSVEHYFSSDPKTLKNMFKSPWVANRYQLFDELGIQYEWEGNRAIAKSKDAVLEVSKLLSKLRNQKNVTLHLQSKVTSVVAHDSQFLISWETEKRVQNEVFDGVVFCSGGMLRLHDSTTSGKSSHIYHLAQLLGHLIIEPSPMLSPLKIENNPFVEFSGTSLIAKLTDSISKKSATGDCLFTHQGISGPVVLDFSAQFSGGDVLLNFLPELSEEVFTTHFNLLRQGKNGTRNFLKQFFPQKMIDWFLSQSQILSMSNIADVSKEQFSKLRNTIFRFSISNAKLMDYSCAWTTRGGVDSAEINVATLESRLHKNLFFAGEILDVNGLCGGYNISFAIISAKMVAEKIQKI